MPATSRSISTPSVRVLGAACLAITIASVTGCPPTGSPIGASCVYDLDCVSDGNLCTLELCPRGICIRVPSDAPECVDAGPRDAAVPDAPPVDAPGLDAPGLDASGSDAPDAPSLCTPACDDGNSCTHDACIDGACVFRRIYPCSSVLLADSSRVVAGASGPVFSGSFGVAANVIVPTEETTSHFTVLDGASIVEGVTYESIVGASPIALISPAQSIAATHDGDRYVLSGLFASPAFGPVGELAVSGTPPGATDVVRVMVPAPARIVAASDLLDAPSGLTTTVSWPDGACDAFLVQATLTGSSMSGEAQVLRRVDCDDATLEGGRRRIRIFDDATLAALGARGLEVEEITVGVVNETDCSALFPGETDVPCQAGRLVRVDASVLEPPVCGPPVSFAGTVYVCWAEAAGTCGATRAGTSCPDGGIDALNVDTRSGSTLSRYPIVSTSVGTISGMRINGIPADTDVTVVLTAPSATLTYTFRYDGVDTLTILDFSES